MIHAATSTLDERRLIRESPEQPVMRPDVERRSEATQATCAGLDLLRALDWLVLHDLTLALGPAESPVRIDHLLAGPSGVYLVASVVGHGPVRITEDDLRWGDRSFADVLTEIGHAADALRRRLGNAPVAPMLCLERLEPTLEIVSGVGVCAAENILGLLTDQPANPAALPPVVVGSQIARFAGKRAASVRRASAAIVAGGPRHRAAG